MTGVRTYASARGDLLAFLESSGFKPHPLEVFCPSPKHCWVDVAAVKGPDLWAFEYKSHSDSIRRGFEAKLDDLRPIIHDVNCLA
jgi:hypothetical protein